jgi:hypothetical protein
MSEVAATPSGGAEATARPQPAQAQAPTQQPSEKPSITDRIKAAMYSEEPKVEEGRKQPVIKQHRELDGSFGKGQDVVDEPEAPVKAPEGEAEQAESPDRQSPDEDADNGANDEQQAAIKSLSELAEGLGWDLEKVLDLETPTKINGKEGKVALRDLVKSHQLEGHLNQGLMRLSEDRKAFEAETGRKVTEIQARVQQLNQAVSLAQKILDGEYADVNWQELQRTDPAAFQAKYGAYNMRLDGIRQLNETVNQENERVKATQQADQKSYLEEQSKLLDSKIPEWADKGKRDKDVSEMVTILADSYGITEQEVRSCVDHRQILLARDAMRWQKLQKSKPATLNKVRAAPKLIKPGSQQSRTTQAGMELQKAQQKLRSTGKVQDTAQVLKHLIF